MIGTSVIFGLLRAILVSSLETKSLPRIMMISSLSRILLTVVLVLLGTGAIGITIGYLSAFVSSVILISFRLVTILIPIDKKPTIKLYHSCKNIFVASVPTWVTHVVGVLGSHLGTIIIFGNVGASPAGSYFVALSVFYVITSLRESIFDIAFPILSAMEDQRKRLTWKLIKMSLVITLPLSWIVILYSDQVIGLIGPSYLQGSVPLKILMFSMLTTTFSVGIATLVYSYGNYRQVLAIGLGSNVFRILFYFILVPLYGSVGAAVSFTVGSIGGFILSLIIAKKIRMKIFWKELALIFVIPTAIALTFEYLHVNVIMGAPILLVSSILLFFKLHILSKSDISESLQILPKKIREPLINIINKL